MSDVANALRDRASRLGTGTGALDPLALQVLRDFRSDELPVARVLHRDAGARDRRSGIEKREALPIPRARRAPRDPCRHHGLPVIVERCEHVERAQHLRRDHVGVLRFETRTDFKAAGNSCGHGAKSNRRRDRVPPRNNHLQKCHADRGACACTGSKSLNDSTNSGQAEPKRGQPAEGNPLATSQTRMPHRKTVAPTDPSATVQLGEVLAALSHALDITEGHPRGHAARACLIGMRLAHIIGLRLSDRAHLFYALLLKDAGCSSNAARVHQLFGGNDHEAKRAIWTFDWRNVGQQAAYVFEYAGKGASSWRRLAHLARIASAGPNGRKALFA